MYVDGTIGMSAAHYRTANGIIILCGCIYVHTTFICVFFVCFRSYLFVHEPFAQAMSRSTVSRSTEEGHPHTVVEVWARSVQCVAHGVRSNIFFGGTG